MLNSLSVDVLIKKLFTVYLAEHTNDKSLQYLKAL